MEVNGKIECLKFLKKHKNKVFQASARKIEKIIKNLPTSIDYHLDFSDFPDSIITLDWYFQCMF